MTANQIKEVVEQHKNKIDISSRAKVTWTCQFVEDLLRAELEHLKKTKPTATVTISEVEKAIQTVKELWFSIDDMDTDELVKERIWN